MKKVAFLVDGGFFTIRIKEILGEKNAPKSDYTPKNYNETCNLLMHAIKTHLNANEEIYRIFYYDCKPFVDTIQKPVSKENESFSNTKLSRYKEGFFNCLIKYEYVALRMGTLKPDGWSINDNVDIKKSINSLTDSDYHPNFKQKGVDMKLGIDIATLSLNKLVDRIVMICGDTDFAPAAKLARVEGICVTLDPMDNKVNPELLKHVDQCITIDLSTFMKSGLYSDLKRNPTKIQV